MPQRAVGETSVTLTVAIGMVARWNLPPEVLRRAAQRRRDFLYSLESGHMQSANFRKRREDMPLRAVGI